MSRIRQLASTDKKGTNVLGLLEALEKTWFQAKGVRGKMGKSVQIPKPATRLMFIIKEVFHHYMVIYATTKKYMTKAMDPLTDGHTSPLRSHERTSEKCGRVFW